MGGMDSRQRTESARKDLASIDPGRLHALRDARRVLQRRRLSRREEDVLFEEIRSARWRHKNGLEHRCLVALIHAPDELPNAREKISPADFLTPAYAALAAALLEGPRENIELARRAIVGRPYLPDEDDHDWAAEALDTVTRLADRRCRPRAP